MNIVVRNFSGQFNLLDSKREYQVSLQIFGDDGKIVQDENGIKAHAYFVTDIEEKDEFEDPLYNIDRVVERAFEYAENIISSTDYFTQTVFFVKVYNENKDALEKYHCDKRDIRIHKKIEELKSQLEEPCLGDPTYSAIYAIQKKITKLNKFLDSKKRIISNYVEDSDLYKTTLVNISSYEFKIKEYEDLLKVLK